MSYKNKIENEVLLDNHPANGISDKLVEGVDYIVTGKGGSITAPISEKGLKAFRELSDHLRNWPRLSDDDCKSI